MPHSFGVLMMLPIATLLHVVPFTLVVNRAAITNLRMRWHRHGILDEPVCTDGLP